MNEEANKFNIDEARPQDIIDLTNDDTSSNVIPKNKNLSVIVTVLSSIPVLYAGFYVLYYIFLVK